MPETISVLFVCRGNICRSPTALGVFRKLVHDAGLDSLIQADSCGLNSEDVGEPPDERSQRAAARRGYDISCHRARNIRQSDFDDFDLLLALDATHLEGLRQLCPSDRLTRIGLLLSYAPELGRLDVPDPYYGDDEGFEVPLDLIEVASKQLLRSMNEQIVQSQPEEDRDSRVILVCAPTVEQKSTG